MANPNDPGYLEKTFTYHEPNNDQIDRYTEISEFGADFAEKIMEFCPDSAEKTLALRKIQEAIMWANASIAINESGIKRPGVINMLSDQEKQHFGQEEAE